MKIRSSLNQWFRSRRIGTKFLLVTLPAIGLSALLFSAALVQLEALELRQVNMDLADQRAQRDAYLLGNPVWNLEEDTIRAILLSLSRDPRIRCIRLQGVLDYRDEYTAGDCVEDASLHRISTAVQYLNGNEVNEIGQLEHWVDVSVDRQELWEDISQLIVLVLILALVLSICVFVAFRRTILTPLNQVADSIRAYQEEGIRAPVNWTLDDELGRFIREYNEGLVRQEQAERSLQEQLNFQTALKNTLPTPFAFVDPDWRVFNTNPAFFQQLLLDPDAPVPALNHLLPPIDWNKIAGLKPGQTHYAEITLEQGSLQGRTFFLTASPYLGSNGQIQGHALVLQDITERKRGEEALMAAMKRTEQALQDLKRAQQSLVQSEKLASLGSLVAGIAHEINTPVGSSLTVATALTERTLDLRREIDSGSLRKSSLNSFLADVEEACKILHHSLMAAAEQIQNFKQVAVDQTSSQRRQFDLKTTVEEVLSTLRPRIKHSRHRLDVNIAEGILLDSYPGPLGQVVTNCFTNALIHGFEDIEAGVISVQAQTFDETRIRLEIRDNGRGMNPEHLKRVFDPFFTTRMGQGGTGLGMNLVYTIVTGLLGGTIHVESQPGQGTRVCLELPQVAPKDSDMVLDQPYAR